MSKHYRCDRCRVELAEHEHRQIEIDGERKDVCGGACLDLVGTFKAKAEAIVEETLAERRRRIAELKKEYWSLEASVDATP